MTAHLLAEYLADSQRRRVELQGPGGGLAPTHAARPVFRLAAGGFARTPAA